MLYSPSYCRGFRGLDGLWPRLLLRRAAAARLRHYAWPQPRHGCRREEEVRHASATSCQSWHQENGLRQLHRNRQNVWEPVRYITFNVERQRLHSRGGTHTNLHNCPLLLELSNLLDCFLQYLSFSGCIVNPSTCCPSSLPSLVPPGRPSTATTNSSSRAASSRSI